MAQDKPNDRINALGFIEVRGLAAAIETADCMLKSAEVRLLRQLLRDPVQTTITVEGSLGACRAAIDAGQASAIRMGAFVASQVMGRPANDTADFVLRLAEAGREPFGQLSPQPRSAPAKAFANASATASAAASAFAPAAAPAPQARPTASDAGVDQKILAALAGLPGGYGAQSLAKRVGGTIASVRQRLEALCSSGKLIKRGSRYLLAKPGGDDK
jgi:ethanolamine utilization protein EutK